MGRRLATLVAVTAAAVAAPLAAPAQATAESCAYQSPEEKYEQADAAIVASVVEATSHGPLSAQIRFRVLEIHKGAQFEVGQEVTVEALTWGGPPAPSTVLPVLLRYLPEPGWRIWITSLSCGAISMEDLRRVAAEANRDRYIPICACGLRPQRLSFRWLGGEELLLHKTLARGARFVLGCRVACRYNTRLWLNARAARRVGLGKGREDVVVARARGRISRGRRTVAVRFTEQARRRLATMRRVELFSKGAITYRSGRALIRGPLQLRSGARPRG